MIGIVAEGPADIAVIRNILKGSLGLDRDQTFAIRPELSTDATDLGGKSGFQEQRPEEYSNWTVVLEECRTRTQIQDFLLDQVDDDSLVIVQIDTAEAHLPGYDVARPDRSRADYADVLRARVAEKLDDLLGASLSAGVRYAIAVEETDAWVLTIHETQDKRDTGARLDPKKRLRYVIERTTERRRGKKRSRKEYDLYHELSQGFRDRKKLESYATRNRSLELFIDSLPRPNLSTGPSDRP